MSHRESTRPKSAKDGSRRISEIPFTQRSLVLDPPWDNRNISRRQHDFLSWTLPAGTLHFHTRTDRHRLHQGAKNPANPAENPCYAGFQSSHRVNAQQIYSPLPEAITLYIFAKKQHPRILEKREINSELN